MSRWEIVAAATFAAALAAVLVAHYLDRRATIVVFLAWALFVYITLALVDVP
jgi:hypothetical protein